MHANIFSLSELCLLPAAKLTYFVFSWQLAGLSTTSHLSCAHSLVSILGTSTAHRKTLLRNEFDCCCTSDISKNLSRGALGCSDKKQWTLLCREQGLELEEGNDSEPRHKTNDHEIEAQLILSACSLCSCLCVFMSVKKSRQCVSRQCHDHRLRPHHCSAEEI